VPLLLLGPPFFPIILFGSTTLLTRDERQLLTHAMASDFSVAWQCLSKRTIFVTDQSPPHVIFDQSQNALLTPHPSTKNGNLFTAIHR
jgi:hypothetical protein